MGRGRWVLLGVGPALVATFLATATSLSLQSPERDWGREAKTAARRFVLDRAPAGDGVEFADVEVRPNGNDDERWVCGCFAVRDEEGALGPFRDFWVTVARVPGTQADITNGGFIEPATLGTCVQQAVAGGWNAGVMAFQFPHANTAWLSAVKGSSFTA